MSTLVLVGDALDRLAAMRSGSVQTAVTSPPYLGLRNYGEAGQIGLEASPAEYLARLVPVFRELRRVLRDDGTLWLNIGDSYATRPNGGLGSSELLGSKHSHTKYREAHALRSTTLPLGFKHKDMLGIPWRLAFALQDDGWYLRQDIIWAKPNPMPESVKDRCTKAHEYLFLLTKSAAYFYDAAAILEPSSPNTHPRIARNGTTRGSLRANGGTRSDRPMKAVGRGPKTAAASERMVKANHRFHEACSQEVLPERNKRSVWLLASVGNSDAHFATFPAGLVEPCILAGTSEAGACQSCGAPWIRQLGEARAVEGRSSGNSFLRPHRLKAPDGCAEVWQPSVREAEGWRPSCACPLRRPVPCLVLDPFGGTGTTALVAERLGRDATLIDISPRYAVIATRRLRAEGFHVERGQAAPRREAAE